MAIELPSFNISFNNKVSTAIQRSERGVVGLILKDTIADTFVKVRDKNDIPTGLTADNKELVELCLLGNVTTPLRIELYIQKTGNTLDNILNLIEVSKIDYICCPDATTEEVATLKTRIIGLRENGVKVKGILANCVANNEGIINFTSTNIGANGKTYTASKYTARMAGLIAGTGLYQSITYAGLSEVTSIPFEQKSATETKVNNGELVLFKQANEIRIARGVNSLTSTTEEKGETFKKIKLVDTMDLIEGDIGEVLVNNYIGKVQNTYDNKCVLIAAISTYLGGLSKEGLINSDFKVYIDIDAQIAYLKSINVDVANMSEKDIKEANTGDKVFIGITCKLVDAIEEISIKVTI